MTSNERLWVATRAAGLIERSGDRLGNVFGSTRAAYLAISEGVGKQGQQWMWRRGGLGGEGVSEGLTLGEQGQWIRGACQKERGGSGDGHVGVLGEEMRVWMGLMTSGRRRVDRWRRTYYYFGEEERERRVRDKGKKRRHCAVDGPQYSHRW